MKKNRCLKKPNNDREAIRDHFDQQGNIHEAETNERQVLKFVKE